MDLQYPVGKFTWNRSGEGLLASEAERQQWLADIEETPARLRAAVAGLTEAQLDTPYRPGGWTVRQVVHHLADSHMNAYVRFRLALTEDEPTIKPYNEELWAELERRAHGARRAFLNPARYPASTLGDAAALAEAARIFPAP